MIPHGVEVFVGLDPIDLRWGFNRLAGVVSERLGRNARSGALFVFFGKRRTAVKVLFFDGSGMCLFYKRLDARLFRVLEREHTDDTSVSIDESTLDDWLDGIDLEQPVKRRRTIVH